MVALPPPELSPELPPASASARELDALLADLRALVGAELALYHDVRHLDGAWVRADLRGDEVLLGRAIDGHAEEPAAPDLPERGDANRFRTLEELPPATLATLRERLPEVADRAEAMLYTRPPRAERRDAGEFLGRLLVGRGALGRPFSDRQRAALDDAVPELVATLRALRIAQRDALASTIELEAGVSALVFSRGGNLEHGSRGALRWLQGGHTEAVRGALGEFWGQETHARVLDGVTLRFTRMAAVGTPRVLVTLEPARAVRLSPLYALSRRQREVAYLAAKGVSAPEIGTLLSISAATVRVHLKAVYQALAVGSRAELGRLFESLS